VFSKPDANEAVEREAYAIEGKTNGAATDTQHANQVHLVKMYCNMPINGNYQECLFYWHPEKNKIVYSYACILIYEKPLGICQTN
jgi:hypothetical protein